MRVVRKDIVLAVSNDTIEIKKKKYYHPDSIK